LSLLIIAAAGSGRRLGRREPKALVRLLGRPLISWTLDALSGIPFERTAIAVPVGCEGEFEAANGPRTRIIAGGNTRAASVRLAFAALAPGSDDLVCVHDAARPLVSALEVRSVLEAAERAGAAIAAIPLVDTVKQVEADRVVATLDRRRLFAAATPQVFRSRLLASALASGREETDEAALLEALGCPVLVVAVSRLAFKITTPEDLEMAEAILRARDTGRGTRGTSR
jgi:2-C-methyl-D-erythritol 4-phosphate cytidylyltransferase